ncbi:hypothetical protein R3P38DRAFT_1461932 [Favolaschia claudopus]|uniref:Uncharacterized protein n=1 Tax=Favolaschia claudopus TaxID=2862362 RepID=A0AAW0DL97_9AGAR
MQLFAFSAAFLAAAVSAVSAQATTLPVLSSFGADGCAGAVLDTWTGVPEDGSCHATPGAVSVNVKTGTAPRCTIDAYTTAGCEPSGFFSPIPVADACFSPGQSIASVRIVCITAG